MLDQIISNPLALSVVILSVAVVALFILTIIMWRKLHRFLVGSGSVDLDGSIRSVSADLTDLKSFRKELEDYLTTVEKRLKKSVRSVRTVRFNPWHGAGLGGDQSFATAFMDENGDGVVISTLYSRDHVSIFGKPLKKHGSEHELSDEERRAVEEAKVGLE
ncbi:MAG: DUF4446 family protein [Patescibacteria group bacterium]|nr:DUF4446 family protein [Patescibacteria group bacterium]